MRLALLLAAEIRSRSLGPGISRFIGRAGGPWRIGGFGPSTGRQPGGLPLASHRGRGVRGGLVGPIWPVAIGVSLGSADDVGSGESEKVGLGVGNGVGLGEAVGCTNGGSVGDSVFRAIGGSVTFEGGVDRYIAAAPPMNTNPASSTAPIASAPMPPPPAGSAYLTAVRRCSRRQSAVVADTAYKRCRRPGSAARNKGRSTQVSLSARDLILRSRSGSILPLTGHLPACSRRSAAGRT